jgi:hypothetical protein
MDVPAAAIIVFGAFFGPLLQLFEGTLSSYLTVLRGLVEHGGLKTLMHRIPSEISDCWPLLACALGSGLLALLLDRTAFVSAAADVARAPIASLRSIMNLKSTQFAVLLAAAVLVESQNTGSQNYAFLIPAILAIVPEKRESEVLRAASGALAVAFLTIMLSPPVNRLSSMLSNESTPFVADTIPGVGVSTTLDYLETAQSMLEPPVRARASISEGLPGELDSPAGEVVYLMSLQNGVDAFRAWQAASGVPVRSIASIDFVDLFPSTLLLQPVLGLPIVFDPERNIPPGLVPDLVERWRTADAIVVRRCIEIDKLVAMARPALEQRRQIALDPCWDLYVAHQP